MPDTPAAPAEKPPAVTPPPATPTLGRVIVRYERAGRGGKEVTVIEQLDLPPARLAALLKTLKSALGCGGSVEGDTLMLQGDHRKRLPEVLNRHGARKVIVS